MAMSAGVRWFSGAGTAWTVRDHSTVYNNARQYNLANPLNALSGTSDKPLGNSSFAFNGPNTQSLPYTFTVDMGCVQSFTHWRVAGNPHYAFGEAHLQRWDEANNAFVRIPGSDVDYWTGRHADGFAYGVFDQAVVSSRYRVCITSYGNNEHFQACFQCYLSEVQFGSRSKMHVWRAATRAIGRLVLLQHRASQRIYAPGGEGYRACREEFLQLASGHQPSEQQQPSREDGLGAGGSQGAAAGTCAPTASHESHTSTILEGRLLELKWLHEAGLIDTDVYSRRQAELAQEP